jgi:hypothetical protein
MFAKVRVEMKGEIPEPSTEQLQELNAADDVFWE